MQERSGGEEKARWGRKGGHTIFINVKVRSLGVLFSEDESRIEYRLMCTDINYSVPVCVYVRSIEAPVARPHNDFT